MTIRRIVIRKTPERKRGWLAQISRHTITWRVSRSNQYLRFRKKFCSDTSLSCWQS